MTSIPRLLPILLLILLQGCLATWMRMEDGTVLQPSEALRRSVRLGLAETLVAQQASLAAPRAPAPGGGQPWG